jgi:hypothetical protein
MGTLIDKTSYDLGLMVAANVATCGLPIDVQEYYLTNRHLIPEALRRGFVLPSSAVQNAPVTDLNFWLTKTEEFAEKHLGMKINLRERFAIPAELPWPSAIPIFCPAGMANRLAVKILKDSSSLSVYEEVDVMKYSGSQATQEPDLYFIQNSVRPDEDTMGMSPDQLIATDKNWLDLRGYALAFGIYRFTTGKCLDPQTFTWFPNNRLAGGEVAHGRWRPLYRQVRFNWHGPGDRDGDGGARLTISVPLLP